MTHVIKKSLGQNFLQHASIAERMVDAAQVPLGTTVLEIGPGTGMLTRVLLTRGYSVIAIEADHELIPVLGKAFEAEIAGGKLTLMSGDVRTFDSGTISTPYAVIANIPYYITGEIVRKFLTAPHKPASMTLLVQKEVAQRIARSTKESLLSLSVKAFGTPRYCFTVPRGSFFPIPNVDSAVLSIDAIASDSFPNATAQEWFFTVLHAGFAHKRKLLRRNLEEIAPEEEILHAFEAAHIDIRARAEDILLASWKSLAKTLSVKG